jgi:hypothetical protein
MENDALERIQGNPVSNAIYEALTLELGQLGEHVIEVKKTSLHIARGRAFLGVHPRKNGLLLNIVLNRPLASDRLRKSEQVSANRYHHEIELGAAAELDKELLGWIGEAHALTA